MQPEIVKAVAATATLTAALVVGQAVQAEELFIFVKDGCPPCKKLKDDLAKDTSPVAGHDVYMIDIGKNPELAKKHGVSTVPHFILMRKDGGDVIRRKSGYSNPQVLKDWLGGRTTWQ